MTSETVKKIVDALCEQADAAYYDHRATHIMFIQCYDEHDRRGPQATNLGTMSRERMAEIIAALADPLP